MHAPVDSRFQMEPKKLGYQLNTRDTRFSRHMLDV